MGEFEFLVIFMLSMFRYRVILKIGWETVWSYAVCEKGCFLGTKEPKENFKYVEYWWYLQREGNFPN